jgi:2-isopropylmalate synthase
VIETVLVWVQEWTRAAKELLQDWPQVRIGIHTHNDCDMAVASSLAAVRGGATLIQGCMNGYGERTGNANLVSLYTSLLLESPFPLVYTA